MAFTFAQRPPDRLAAFDAPRDKPSPSLAAPGTSTKAAAPIGGSVDPQHAAELYGHFAEPDPTAATPGVCVAPAPPVDPRAQLLKVQATMNAQLLVMAKNGIATDAGRQMFLTTLDRIDDPELRKLTLAEFEKQTRQSVQDFAAGCHDLKKRDAGVINDLVSEERGAAEKELAELPPEKLKEMQDKADEEALEVLKVTRATDANDDENAQKIFRALGPRDAKQMELIRRAIRLHTHGDESLYTELDKHMHGANEDEAVQDMSGDRVANTVAGLKNADGDKARASELLRDALKSGKLADVKARLGADGVAKLLGSVKGAEKVELEWLLDGKAAAADAVELGDLLKDPGEGMSGTPSKQDLKNLESRKAENVLKQFEAKSPEEILAAEKEWDAQQQLAKQAGFKSRTFKEMIKDRFADSDPGTYARMAALLDGNVGKDKALELKQAMAHHDQAKIEAALSDPELASKDPKKRAEAEERKKQMDEAMRAEDKLEQQALKLHRTGQLDTKIEGRGMEEQLHAYYKQLEDDPLKGADLPGGIKGAAEATLLRKAGDHAKNDEIGVDELLAQGKFTVATQLHRAREDGDKKLSAELIDKIETTKERDADQKEYDNKYHEKMFKDPVDTLSPMQKLAASQMDPEQREKFIREHMTRNEMLEDNVRRYGAHAERDVEKEQKLQQELYDRQSSGSLELDEMLRGGGSQLWARQELAARQQVLAAGKRDAQGKLHLEAEGREQANRLDKGASAALATQEEEKVKLGERVAKAFSIAAKLGCLLIGQPELVFLADMATSLTEMAIKASIEGEAYDATADAKMMAVTAMADAACIGLSGMAKTKNLGPAKEVEAAEAEAEAAKKLAETAGAEEKVGAAVKGERAATEEAEDKALQVIDPYGRTKEARAAVAADAELKEAREALETTKLRNELPGKLAHGTITSVGGGIVNGKDPSEIMLDVGLGWLGELTGGLDKRVAGSLFGGSKLGEAGAAFTRKTALSIAGGKSSAGDIGNVALGVYGDYKRASRVDHHNEAHHEPEQQKLYAGGEVEAEMAEEKKKEELERKAKLREQDEQRELYEHLDEAGTGEGA